VMMRLWRAVSRFSLNGKSFPLPLAEMPAYALILSGANSQAPSQTLPWPSQKEGKAPVVRPVVEGIAKALFLLSRCEHGFFDCPARPEPNAKENSADLLEERERPRWSRIQWAVSLDESLDVLDESLVIGAGVLARPPARAVGWAGLCGRCARPRIG